MICDSVEGAVRATNLPWSADEKRLARALFGRTIIRRWPAGAGTRRRNRPRNPARICRRRLSRTPVGPLRTRRLNVDPLIAQPARLIAPLLCDR
jgi:hypothetical protein